MVFLVLHSTKCLTSPAIQFFKHEEKCLLLLSAHTCFNSKKHPDFSLGESAMYLRRDFRMHVFALFTYISVVNFLYFFPDEEIEMEVL